MEKGIFCLSLDCELMWGRQHLRNRQKFHPSVKKEPQLVKKLLVLFQSLNIPATWGVVGKMLEPGQGQLWSGSELIKQISKTPGQEIACHSLSHPSFLKISRASASKELKGFQELAIKNNLPVQSLIFPFDQINHLDLLKTYGFKSFRGNNGESKLEKFLKLILPLKVQVFSPGFETGLVKIPGSMYFVSNRGLRRFIPPKVRFKQAKRGIDRAIREKKLFHLWTHPIDLVDVRVFREFGEVLEYAAKRRQTGDLEIKNMRQIATDYQSYGQK